MVLTVSSALFPETRLSCLRRLRIRNRKLDASLGAPEPHVFAVRKDIVRRARIAPDILRPSHPELNVRDDRDTSLK
jgi:hypothetical protein